MGVEALDTRADEKILPERWRFFSTACLPLGLCFFECKNFGSGSALLQRAELCIRLARNLRTKWRNDEDRFTWSVLWVDFLYFLKFPISYEVEKWGIYLCQINHVTNHTCICSKIAKNKDFAVFFT